MSDKNNILHRRAFVGNAAHAWPGRAGHRRGRGRLDRAQRTEPPMGLADRPEQVHRLRQLCHALRLGRIGRKMYAQLRHVRLLRPLHRLLPPGTDRPELRGGEPAMPDRAIRRTFVEEPYFEYTIDERLCIGCGKCVKGCNTFGNGSLFCRSTTTAASTATSARSPSHAPRKPTAACRPISPTS